MWRIFFGKEAINMEWERVYIQVRTRIMFLHVSYFWRFDADKFREIDELLYWNANNFGRIDSSEQHCDLRKKRFTNKKR